MIDIACIVMSWTFCLSVSLVLVSISAWFAVMVWTEIVGMIARRR